jgi:DNA-directed RNA polymerase specialized sigma24 family protein
MAELATVLDGPENTVKTRIHRARVKLQECLREEP